MIEKENEPYFIDSTLKVHGEDYYYTVHIAEPDIFNIQYDDENENIHISFASLEEMERLAIAMLKAIKLHRDNP